METKQFRGFTLKEGVHFSRCVAPADICDDTSLNYYTKTSREGELAVDVDKSKPTQATFYFPSRQVCERGTGDGDCRLQVVFSGEDLTSLIGDNHSLSQELSQVGNNHTPTKPPPAGGNRFLGKGTDEGAPVAGDNFDPAHLLPALFFTLAGVAFVYILYKLVGKYLGVGTPGPYRGSSAKRSNTPSVNQSTVRNVASSQQGGVSSEEIRRQLLPIIEKLNSVSSRLSQVETDMFAITQQLQQSSIKASSSVSSLLANNVNALNSQSMPPPPPKPLCVDLIKEALLTTNYSLISSYPHDFVSETAESRQGLEDVKRFAIEGDQSQASGRTQSEFIVIPLFNELYLIPNILPNAADPARTIKRHADKNSIYRNGQGSNLLNLVSLAIVKRNGDRYELANAGQVA